MEGTVQFQGQKPRYLGDGAYASFDGEYVWLESADGIRVTNQVAIERHVWVALVAYVKEIARWPVVA